MDQNLDVDGKKYISARRASEISGYNSDYLGQLCRADKLECKLVSRAWFVSEKSLINHQKTNGRKKYGLRIHTLPEQKENQKSNFFSNNQKLLFSQVSKEVFENKLSLGKRLFDRKLILNSSLAFFISLFFVVVIFDVNKVSVKNNSMVYQNTEKIITNVESFVDPAGALQTASLERTKLLKEKFLESYVSLKNKLQITILTLFDRDKDYLVQKIPINNSVVTPKFAPGDDRGAVMIPISESDISDFSRVKSYLRNSFSDEIEIIPDESGIAGVVKPIFSETNKEEYFYVMVPIK